MGIRTDIAIAIMCVLFGASALGTASDTFERGLIEMVGRLDIDVESDPSNAQVYANLLSEEFGTSQAELRWALDEGLSWGRIAILSYFQATTGRSFGELRSEGADVDLAGFVTNSEMSSDKMIGALEGFLEVAERERNSGIFNRMRASRRYQPLPDLGSGFGLFQEALDFRRLDPPSPTKIHVGTISKAKGENKGNK